MKRSFFVLLIIVVMGSLIFGACAEPAPAPTPTPAPAPTPTPEPEPVETIKLLYGTWAAPGDLGAWAMEPWAKELEEMSGGRVKVELSWGGVLGTPPEYYDLAVGGACDMIHTVLPYTTGYFPMSDIMMLPVQFPPPSGELATKAYLELWKKGYFDKELADSVPIHFLGAPPYEWAWAKEPVTSLADFKGKKIRCSGGIHTKAVEALGAIPIQIPAPETYLALQKGTVDCSLGPWNMVHDFKLHEVLKYGTETFLFSLAFGDFMNKDTFNKLPQDIQAWIKANVEKYSLMSARQGVDTETPKSRDEMLAAGIRIDQLSPADRSQMAKILAPLFDEWVAEMEAKGLPAGKALDDLYLIMQELGVEEPFAR